MRSASGRSCVARASRRRTSSRSAGWSSSTRGSSTPARAPTPTRRPRRPTSRYSCRRRSARRSRSWRTSSWIGTADERRPDGLDVIVTLTTDFGVRDPYVAEMKGAILGIARAAGATVQLVDVTHEVARHDVVEGALALEAAAPFFPRGTVHLAVIDPGVGTARRGIAIAAGDQVFVGPDNGVFTPFLSGTGWRAFELAAAEYRLPAVSRTFHGRDVFAPAAAHVAIGVDVARLGPVVTDPVRLPWAGARARGGVIEGTVIHVDRFGNLVTSIAADAIREGAVVRVAKRAIPLVGTYGDLAPGGLGGLVGSSGRLEIAVREGSAAATLRARRGTRVIVSPTSSSRATASSRTPARGRS